MKRSVFPGKRKFCSIAKSLQHTKKRLKKYFVMIGKEHRFSTYPKMK